MNKDMFKHAGIGGMAVTALMTMLHIKQGGTADTTPLVASGSLSLLSMLMGMLGGNESKDITSIIAMVKAFLTMTGTTNLTAILGNFKTSGIPTYINATISWGKGKSYPFVYGKNPEDETPAVK